MKDIFIHPGYKIAIARALFYMAAWIVAKQQKINRKKKLDNTSNESLKPRCL